MRCSPASATPRHRAAGARRRCGARRTGCAAPAVSGGTAIEAAIAEASSRFAIPPSWIRAVMQRGERRQSACAVAQRRHRPHADHARDLGCLAAALQLGQRSLRRRMTISWAAQRCLRELYDRFGASGFLAAYNAGPSRYLAFLTQGLPLKVETQLYLAKLARLLPGAQIGGAISAPSLPRDWRSAPLFAASCAASDGPVWAAARPGNPSAAVPSAARIKQHFRRDCHRALAPNAAGLFAALTAAVTP